MEMRTLGLIGGMSYHSTIDYYKGINDAVASRVGGHASAPLLLSSVDFRTIRARQVAEDWDGAGQVLAQHARTLQTAGAQALLICANLMHKVAPQVAQAVNIPLLHIADAVAQQARTLGQSCLGILGTKWTMLDRFYADRLLEWGIGVVQASPDDAEVASRIVFEELTRGIVRDDSRRALLEVIDRLASQGAGAVVLACTELPLILRDDDADIPLINSTTVHIEAAVRFCLGEVA
ncbi:MAG: amino acid racemase [Propionibacteriaceae bacterium]|jgi:aspartate racemase|nr:amino acid racemase [Propionibacteriaceae bacterium]